jgi:integrase
MAAGPSVVRYAKRRRVRIIPLHPAVLKVLLPYLQSVIEQHGEGLLFRLPRGSSGKPSVYATRELCRWIRKDLAITIRR